MFGHSGLLCPPVCASADKFNHSQLLERKSGILSLALQKSLNKAALTED